MLVARLDLALLTEALHDGDSLDMCSAFSVAGAF